MQSRSIVFLVVLATFIGIGLILFTQEMETNPTKSASNFPNLLETMEPSEVLDGSGMVEEFLVDGGVDENEMSASLGQPMLEDIPQAPPVLSEEESSEFVNDLDSMEIAIEGNGNEFGDAEDSVQFDVVDYETGDSEPMAEVTTLEGSLDFQNDETASIYETTSQPAFEENDSVPVLLDESITPSGNGELPHDPLAGLITESDNESDWNETVEPQKTPESTPVANETDDFLVPRTRILNAVGSSNSSKSSNVKSRGTASGQKILPVRKSKTTSKAAPVWVPAKLTERIDGLTPSIPVWAKSATEALKSLSSSGGIGDPATGNLIANLARKHQELIQVIRRMESQVRTRADFATVQELRRLEYCMARRIAIWQTTHQLALRSPATRSKASILAASSKRIAFNVDPTWREYLLIDEAESIFNSLNPSANQQRRMARKILSRAYSPSLSKEQLGYVHAALGPNVIELLRETATESPDFDDLVFRLEEHEEKQTGFSGYRLNEHYQNFLWSSDAASKQLAYQLDTHYRNANLRVAISEDFINRLIPQIPSSEEPFSDNIQGAEVFGSNRIQSQIRVQLIPDPNQIHLNLETQGEVHSVTRALKGPFTVDNQGTARYQVFKRLAFGRHGVSSDRPISKSSADQQLVGINSKLDGVPILGRVARRIAQQKLEADEPNTERMVRQRVETDASRRVEQEVQTQLNQATAYLQESILQPLIAMNLEPDPREMSTTQNEVVMRYRLAGRDQMAANTARPRAVANSLFNVQIHQTAINNLLMRMELNGKKFTTDELVAHFEEMFGIDMPNEATNHEASFEFAPIDPIRVDLEDGQVAISLNLRSMRIGKGKRWKNLTVKATYQPQVVGHKVVLNQLSPGLTLKGKNLKLRDQLAVRTIFVALFEDSYNVGILPKNLAKRMPNARLAINQFDVSDGWVGISVADQASPRTTQQQDPRAGRTGRLWRRMR